MRLFIGIDLPNDIKSQIEQTLHPLQLSSKGWEHPHDYHQTLLFIGETDEEKLSDIKRKMDEIHFHSFKLTTSGFAFFNRRIMYVDFLPSTDLMDLKKLVDLKYPEYIRPDEKEFVPHVTVKRWQRYEYDHLATGILKQSLPVMSFTVHSIALFKSERDENNLKYHIVHLTFLKDPFRKI